MTSSPAPPRLVVILSTERSGSTLLSMILGGSRRVVAPPELHGFRYADFESWRQGYPQSMASLSWLLDRLGEESGPETLDRRFAGKPVETVYGELLGLGGPGRLLVDKTPAYARDPSSLARLERFEPLYLWLVRHPLGVAASMHERREARQRPGGQDLRAWPTRLWKRWKRARHDARVLAEDLAYWRRCNVNLRDFLATVPAERQLKLLFEELVEHPEPALARLARFLGIDVEPAMLSPGSRLPETLAQGIGDAKIRGTVGISAAPARHWRKVYRPWRMDRETARLYSELRRAGAPGREDGI
ncbi:sulfotransferase family protein [Marinimicrococcus flavescens]|uniref:Sulfotransferase n=1 Tax=Marinimicrococcus flavescens TaxID=3031815 RepID=A0AAP3UY86_9PROT|nr:sulfotransferase [Marinimicrococcus flavescens]